MKLLNIFVFISVALLSLNTMASDRIVAIVNSVPITENEFADRKKMIIFVNKIPESHHNGHEINNAVLESLVADSIWSEQAEAFGVQSSDDEIKHAIANIEKNNKMPSGHIIPYLESNGVNKATFIAQVKSEIVQSKLSRQMMRNISISESEIESTVISSNQKPVSVDMRIFTAKVDNKAVALHNLKKLSRSLNKLKNCDKVTDKIYKNVATLNEVSSTIDKLDDSIAYGLAVGLNIGEASEPVKIDDHYKVVMVCNRQILDISKDETNYVLNLLGNSKLNQKMQKYFSNLRKRASVKVNI